MTHGWTESDSRKRRGLLHATFWPATVSLLFLLIAGCAPPKPRAPAEIAAERAQAQVRPSWVERLKLPSAKAERITALSARVGGALKDYDVASLLLLDEVLVEIQRGHIDRDRLTPLAEQTLKELDAALPALLLGLNELHATLDAQERQRLVDLFDNDKEKTAEERQQERADRLEQVLDLTATQKAELLPAWLGISLTNWGLIRQLERNVREARTQFLGEQFDARTLSLVTERRPMDMLTAIYQAVQATLPVLTPEQRQTLAAYLDARFR